MSDRIANALKGSLLGTAVGDAVGLPAEGLKPGRIRKWWPNPWRHHFLFGKGMISDDTEHAMMVAQSLLKQDKSAERFARDLAWKLRWWFWALPAGVGLATARACIKLWLGISPSKSGVFSAGNGPAMRAPVLGAYFHDRPEELAAFVEANTLLTHRDPKALTGTLAVARMTALAAECGSERPEAEQLMTALGKGDDDWDGLVKKIQQSLDQNEDVAALAASIGASNGVSGYIYQTVPVAVYACVRHWGDFRQTLTSVLDLGGDTDTVGAVAGGIAGAAVGKEGIPAEWLDGIFEWPRSARVMEQVAEHLAKQLDGETPGPVRYFWPAIPVRNLFFLTVVLFHGFRRLLPPY